jgi:hypothetical protein
MASDSKTTKPDATPKKDVAAKAESPAAKAASPAVKAESPAAKAESPAAKDAPKDTAKDTAKDTVKSGGDTAAAPANYSRGEGQKPVSAAYRENWNAIFADKKTKKKKR